MSADQLYVLGYAYGWNMTKVPPVYLTLTDVDSLIQGFLDGEADRDNNAPPVSDFDAGKHIQREIGTIITCVENVALKEGSVGSNIYVVGDFPDVGKTRFQSIPVNYASSDREWLRL